MSNKFVLSDIGAIGSETPPSDLCEPEISCSAFYKAATYKRGAQCDKEIALPVHMARSGSLDRDDRALPLLPDCTDERVLFPCCKHNHPPSDRTRLGYRANSVLARSQDLAYRQCAGRGQTETCAPTSPKGSDPSKGLPGDDRHAALRPGLRDCTILLIR